MKRLALLGFFILFLLPLAKADEADEPSTCFSEGHVKVLELGRCIQTDNGFKIVLSDVSGVNTSILPAIFKIYSPDGELLDTVTLFPCSSQTCSNYSTTTSYGFSIDLINTYGGIGQTAYADVYVRTWTQYEDYMQIGDEASFPGLRIKLYEISGFPGSSFGRATFRAYDSSGNLVKQFDLWRNYAGQQQEVEDVTNGVLTHLLTAFAGIGQTPYAVVGFKLVGVSPSPVPTATIMPCVKDVYERCADGFTYLKARCVNGVLSEIVFVIDPCQLHGGRETKATPVPPKPPKTPPSLVFKIPVYNGWNMFSIPFESGEIPGMPPEMSSASTDTTVESASDKTFVETGASTQTAVPAVSKMPSEMPAVVPFVEVTTTCNDGPVYVFDESKKKYEKLKGFVKGRAFLESRKGYWFKNTGSECMIIVKGFEKTVLDGLMLEKGWNFIGGPFDSIEFNQIKGDCTLMSGPWFYNTNARKYEKVSVLEPGKGYFIKVASDCTLGESQNLPPLPE